MLIPNQTFEYRGMDEQPTKKGWFIYRFEGYNGTSITLLSKEKYALNKGELYNIDLSIDSTGFINKITQHGGK